MNIAVSDLTLQDKAQWEALYYGYAQFYQVPMDQDILDKMEK